jgi:hypothetical protein
MVEASIAGVNAGIRFILFFRIRHILHVLGYVKILGVAEPT